MDLEDEVGFPAVCGLVSNDAILILIGYSHHYHQLILMRSTKMKFDQGILQLRWDCVCVISLNTSYFLIAAAAFHYQLKSRDHETTRDLLMMMLAD